MRKKKLRRLREEYREKVKKDKPLIDYIRNNLFESNLILSEDLNISIEEVRRILIEYRDAIENEVFYNLDVERIVDDQIDT